MTELDSDIYFVTLRTQIAAYWPQDILPLPDVDALDKVWLTPSMFTDDEQSEGLIYETTLLFEQALSVDFGFVAGLSLILGTASLTTPVPLSVTVSDILVPDPEPYVIEIGPVPITLLVASDLLKRMEVTADGFVESPPDPVTGEPQPVEIILGGPRCTFSSDGEVDFALDEAAGVTIPPFMIGDSGVVIEANNLRLVLSAEAAQSLPASIPSDWRGVFLEQATVHLPEGLNNILPDDVTLQDFFIGSGGFCGKVTGNWDVDPVDPFDDQAGDVFGFQFRLTSIGIEFTQNTLVSGNIAGYLQVPFFDAPLQVEIGLTNDGDFTVALSSDTGLLNLEKPGVISIEVRSLEFTKEDNVFSLTLTGSVTPLLAEIDWPSFDLNGLTISSDGKVKVDGGWITLPELKSLDFYGFKIEISQLGFGSEEDNGADYNWIGFSGGIQIVSGLPLRGGVEGLKVMWNDAGPKLKIGGVSLAFDVEKVLNFDGVAYFIDETDPLDASKRIRGFKGGVDVSLVPLNGAGFDAQFITGDFAGQYKFFYLFLDVEIPVGIPVLPPALGLYGLAGLFAYNMTLDYPALIDYENEAARPDMTDVANWNPREGALAFGAGVTLGTLVDNGFTAKAKVIFAIMIPGPVILIEGYGKILSFENAYPFRVLAVLDVPSGTFLMNIGVTYAFPKASGDLISIDGSAEVLIPAGDLGGWHLYLGQDKPESKRIQADVLSFFTAQTYFMVDQDGLALGVWIGYSLDKKYGVLRVVLESWISSALAVSWMPLQAQGSLTWIGRAELSVAKIGLGISVEATAGAEVPKPLSISGSLTVQLKTPIGKPKATIKIKWEKPGTPPFPIPLAATLGIEHRKVTENWEVPKSSEYGVDADRLWDGSSSLAINIPEGELPLVPPDVTLVLNFDKSVRDVGLIGGNNPDVPPIESNGAYEFLYELNDVTLEYSDTWSTTPGNLSWQLFEDAGSDYSMAAVWQAMPDANGLKNTKLVINATSSLEISRVLEDNSYWLQLLSLYNPDYPCLDEVELTWITINFELYELDQIHYPMFEDAGWVFVAGFPMRISAYDAPWLKTTKSLKTDRELELVRCLLILELAPTPQQAVLLTKGLEIRAANQAGAVTFVRYRTEVTPYLDYLPRTELYINQSNPLAGTPAFIRFAPALFPSWPDKVWITMMVDVQPNTLVIARDGAGNEVDRIEVFSDCSLNPFTYLLQSPKGNPIRKIEFTGLNFRIKDICWNEYERTDISRIWITLPEEMSKLELDLSKGSNGTVYFLDEQNNQLDTVGFNVPDDGTAKPARPVSLNVEHLAFKVILVEGNFELLQVRGLPQATVDAFNDYEERLTNIRTAIEENWGKHTAQILLPNKYYRVRVSTTSKRRKNGNDSWTTANFTEYMYFKTGSPPGTALGPVADTEHYPNGGPLQDLSAYIDTTIPVGAPPNEPQVLHYRSYDVGVLFNDSYIEQMYQAAGFSLGIKLLDNNLQPVLDADGEEIFLNGWGDNPTLSLTREETQYSTLWNKENCLGISNATPENTQELMASSVNLQLLPQTQYKAQLWAGDQHQLYEFVFLTSRYASFLHHVHDFADAVWDHMSLLGNPEFEIDTVALTASLQNSGGLSDSVRFEQLMEIFDLSPRVLPQRLEVTLLNDKNQSYGLLLESPEPLPAERVQTITISIADIAETIEEFQGTVKLIRADLNEQLIEVLLLERTDLSGYRIEYRSRTAEDDEPFNLYYTFAAASVFPAGTKLIINNGEEPGVAPPPAEHVPLYAGHSTQSFVPGGIVVRIVDVQDTIVHQRPFLRNSRYTTQDVHLIRNQDETRLLFFIKQNGMDYSSLTRGIYRVAFTFLRDTGDPKSVLRRFGFSDEETGQIEFSLPTFLP